MSHAKDRLATSEPEVAESVEEIAVLLGTDTNTVWVRLHRARAAAVVIAT
jgi:hypothetical protein